MTNGPEISLWNQFNLAENNPDPGGGILYAIRYDTESLIEHRDSVVATAVKSGLTIFETSDGGLGVDASGLTDDERQRAHIILEELSVVSEAIEYHEVSLKPTSVEQLSAQLRSDLLIALTQDQSAAFDIAHYGIPQIVRDIEMAHAQNEVLSPEDQQTIKALGGYAATRAKQIANDEIVVINL